MVFPLLSAPSVPQLNCGPSGMDVDMLRGGCWGQEQEAEGAGEESRLGRA